MAETISPLEIPRQFGNCVIFDKLKSIINQIRKLVMRSPKAKSALERLGHDIRYARLRRGITVADLAVRAGTSPSSIARLERGGRGVAIGTLAGADNGARTAPGPLLRGKAETAEGSDGGKAGSVSQLHFTHARSRQFPTFACGTEWIEKTFRRII